MNKPTIDQLFVDKENAKMQIGEILSILGAKYPGFRIECTSYTEEYYSEGGQTIAVAYVVDIKMESKDK